MSRVVFLNGEYLPYENSKVHIEDRGYQFADGVYEVFAVTENKLVGMAIGIAKKMGGDMTGAIKKIEKISKGLSKQKAVKDALQQANESVNEAHEMSIKDAFKDLVKKHGGTKALDILTSVLAPMGFEDPKNKKEFQQKLLN